MTPGSHLLENPDEVLLDVISLCAKVWNDNEAKERVHMVDLLELRDLINDIRRHATNGGGYASMPRLIRPGKDE